MQRLLKGIGLGTWRRRLIALAIVFPIFGVVSVEVTSQSWFCNSCHIMNPYYDSWRRGAHKDVECVKCHIPPGMDNFLAAKFNGLGQVVDDVLSRTSMKPSTAVDALACTRSGCHDLGKVKTTEKTAGKFLFKHEKHLGLEYKGIKVACSTCHSHVKGDQHFEVESNVCVTCHLIQSGARVEVAGGTAPELLLMAVREGRSKITPTGDAHLLAEPPAAAATTGPVPVPAPAPVAGTASVAGVSAGEKTPSASCLTCHNAPTKTIERGGLKINHSEYLSYGATCESCHRGNTAVPVPIENGACFGCHTFGLERLTSVEDMHAKHLQGQHKIECFSCHGTVHHGPAAQTARLEQLDCRQCHADQHGVQRETYLHKAEAGSSVSPMFMAHVDCTGCHIDKRPVSVKPDSGATVAAAVPEACDTCHQVGFGKELVTLWQKTTHSLFDQMALELKNAEERVTSEAGKLLLAEVRHIQELIKVDGSWGVHNPKYTQQLLEQGRRKIREAVGEVKQEAAR